MRTTRCGRVAAANVVGWLNTRMYLETGDEAASQGWAPLIADANANGQLDQWVGPDEPIDQATGSTDSWRLLCCYAKPRR